MVNFQTIWKKWKKFTEKVVFYQSRFLLNVIYFIFIAPIAIVFKFFSNPLNIGGKPHWIYKRKDNIRIEELKNQ